MAIFSQRIDYNGFLTRVSRHALAPLLDEAESAVTAVGLRVLEAKHANGTQGLRRRIDAGFEAIGGWTKTASGGIDWVKGGVGVEVQVSGRSDMLAVDIIHLRQRITYGEIDVGLIIVPDDPLSNYLTDRTPNLRTAVKHLEEHRATDLPIRIAAFMHIGPGPALPKIVTNLGGQ